MLRNLLNKLKNQAKHIAAYAGVFAVLSMVAGNFYMFHRISDLSDGYIGLSDRINQESMQRNTFQNDIKDAIHEKQLACVVLNEKLKSTFSSGKFSYDYCKP